MNANSKDKVTRSRFAAAVFATMRLGWLVVASAMAGGIFSFYLGLIVPGFDVRVLLGWLGWMMLGGVAVVLGVAAMAGRLRWLLSPQAGRFHRWSALLLVSVVVLFYSIEKWRGHRAWSLLGKTLSARGETLDLASIIPPPVPDDQNFAMAPIMAPLSDLDESSLDGAVWRDPAGYQRLAFVFRSPLAAQSRPYDTQGAPWQRQQRADLERRALPLRSLTNAPAFATSGVSAGLAVNAGAAETNAAAVILAHCAGFSNELEQIRLAAQRPQSRFRVAYEKGIGARTPHVRVLGSLVRVLEARALAELESGRPVEAVEDTRLGLRLAGFLYRQPVVYAHERCAAVVVGALQPVWEGLCSRRWTAEQILRVEEELERMHALEQYEQWTRTMTWINIDFVSQIFPTDSPAAYPTFLDRGNTGAEYFLDFLRLVCPSGWSYQNRAGLYYTGIKILALVDAGKQRVYPERVPGSVEFCSLDPFYAVYLAPKFTMVAEESRPAAFAQTAVDLAQVGCALERYRLAHGSYPAALKGLAPGFLKRIPHDIVNGEPLRYRLNPDGHFTLYSVGWNQVDDQAGVTLWDTREPISVDLRQGDWVWEYPSTR